MSSLDINVYLSASYPRADEMNGCKSVLQEVGYTIVSTWHDSARSEVGVTDVTIGELQSIPEHCKQFAIRDLDDLRRADVFFMFTGDEKSSGGRHTELGLAMGLDNIKGIVIIGPRENVFHCLDGFMVFPDWKIFCVHLFRGLASLDNKRGKEHILYVKDIVGEDYDGEHG